jgi:class 3 adenylate cyclase/ActR/RegA family two-component response regulator
MKAKILVVDDEPDVEQLIRQKFRRQIREENYQFLFANNGYEALEQLSQNADIDFVLSDINMPRMDGLTLLLKLQEINPLLKTVIISAYGDMDNIRVAMNRGAFDFITKPIDFADLELTMDKTYKQVLQIRETLQAVKENNILKMYVDETVLQFMNREEFSSSLMANETIEAAVVFIDICGFTAITEREPADTVVNLLNRYFDVMVKEIIAHEGQVDKFMGDAIMAVFRGADHLERAIRACLAVRTSIELLLDQPQEQATFLPKLSIGINSGEMISGNIGSATLRRLDYTVIGDSVNLAQRLQTAARPGQIVINEILYEKIKTNFPCREIGEASFKNRANPIMIYEIL